MTSPERRKGSTWELAIVAYLRDNGHPHVERAYGAGRPDDRGDIDGLGGWTIEAKNHKTMDLAGWCDEAAREASAEPGSHWWAVVAKRRNRSTADAYVVMPLSQFAQLLSDEPGSLYP